jgi:glycine hydroxymethyltransferase
LEHQIYAKLICFKELLKESSKLYTSQIIKNAKVMEETFKDYNFKLIADGTDNHLMTLDLSDFKYSGKQLSSILAECGIITNCNSIPNDKKSFLETSGIRLGVPAITARGLNENDIKVLTIRIASLITLYKNDGYEKERKYMKSMLNHIVHILTKQYPLRELYPKTAERLKYIEI